ncbi:MAG: PQQ-binding-like beta-propeller repeat protein [Myxococcales bacterium]|nr:PQQ-like beta-propeller repeat protein [Myxococcota bacterium]MDW8280575.1 PQQ-binding-like beta-propeller repeat protein [Myxococcales bacterium]
MRRHWILLSALTGLLAGSGCAEAPFSVHAIDNDRKMLQATLGRIRPGPPGPYSGRPMAYILAGPERREDSEARARTLIGFDLARRQVAYAVPAEVTSRFAVGKGILVHRQGQDRLVIRDAATGQVRAQVPLDPAQVLLGICADEERVYYVTQGRGRGQKRSLVTALGFDGQRLWRVPAPGSVGAPAAHGGLVAVPYRYQDVVLLDGRTGAELTRIRQKDEQIGFVRATSEGILYGVGDRGVALLTERSVEGTKEKIAYQAPKLGDKVRVFLYWDGYRPEQVDFSAFDRNRLLWSPERKGEGLAFRGGVMVLHSYRFFFAVESESGRIRWAYAQPRHNIMASDETGGAVVFVTQDGEVGALDLASGAKVMSHKIPLQPGQQVLGATFDAAGFAPPLPEGTQTPAVLSVLHDIIFDRDSSFIAVKTFAVQAVSTLPGKEATAELLRVVTAEGMPQQVTRAAGEALVARKDREVSQMLVAALSERFDYLEDRRPRGLGILARAAAAMDAQEAVPALSEQLREPTTPPSALKEIVGALVALGNRSAVRPLRELVLMYRSDPAFLQDAEALKLAGEGLLKLGGEAERRTVSFVAEEPRTIAPVVAYYRKILDETAIRPGSKVKAAEQSP